MEPGVMKKAVGYVRVSSKEQREEGYSIPAQRKLLEEYAAREDFSVVEWFPDVT
jgi:DNA invertase Pin-like site-specific DNA recombinase